MTLVIVETNDEGVATLDETGKLTGLEGGWVIVAAQDAGGVEVVRTDTIRIAGGKTKVGKEKGGKAFADDLASNVKVPPGALKRDAKIKLERQGKNDLPPQAQGKGKVVVAFDIAALDPTSEEDISDEGFDAPVEITLSYTDDDLATLGIDEGDLGVGVFDEESEVWDMIPDDLTVAVDTETNTITVATTHFSLWGVLEASSVPTAVEATSWGAVKLGTAGQATR